MIKGNISKQWFVCPVCQLEYTNIKIGYDLFACSSFRNKSCCSALSCDIDVFTIQLHITDNLKLDLYDNNYPEVRISLFNYDTQQRTNFPHSKELIYKIFEACRNNKIKELVDELIVFA